MSRFSIQFFTGIILSLLSSIAIGATTPRSNGCEADFPKTVYLSATCAGGDCLGQKSFYYLEKGHSLACSKQVRFKVATLDASDKALAITILKAMNRRDGAFVAEVDLAKGNRCAATGGAFCIGKNVVKIRTAAIDPGSAIVLNNLATALKRKQHVNEGLILGEIFFLGQVVFSSFAILFLGSRLIGHEKRRLIAGIITMAYMSIFVYFYGMEAFFVRAEAVPLVNAGMLAIMLFCVFSAVRGMLQDLLGGFKVVLHIAVFVAEGVMCLYLLMNPVLDLVTVAFGVFYVGIPALLAAFSLGCTFASMKATAVEGAEILEEGSSYSFG